MNKNTVDRVMVIVRKLILQSPEKIGLFLGKSLSHRAPVIGVEALYYHDTSVTASGGLLQSGRNT